MKINAPTTFAPTISNEILSANDVTLATLIIGDTANMT